MNRFICVALLAMSGLSYAEDKEIAGTILDYGGKPLYKFYLTAPGSDEVSLRLLDEIKELRIENEILQAQLDLYRHQGAKK